MALPELDVARVRRWCLEQVPEAARSELQVDCVVAKHAVTVIERRPGAMAGVGDGWSSVPVARLRFTATSGLWTLYWSDRHSRFHRYSRAAPTAVIADLLHVIAVDQTGIFWG